jgi:hypothetical protein
MKTTNIHVVAAVILLLVSVFSLVDGAVVADPATVVLAGMTGAGMLICENSMRVRRRLRPLPSLDVTEEHWRNRRDVRISPR